MEQYFVGLNAINDLERILRETKRDKVFVVRGKKSYAASGAEDVIRALFERLDIKETAFCDYSPNPDMKEIDNGVDAFKKSGSKIIMGIGGGSAMDTAKLIRHKGDLDAILITIPTTSGTGAEVTKFAIAYVNGMKNSFEGDGMLPDYAFVYPPFTFSNPKYLTACTGFDAVGQCIEACWNVNATEESDKFALDGLKLMWDVLPKALEGMTEDDRCKMAEGAYLSGRAINITRTTAPHAFSYIFTSHYGYAHGHAVALSFPFFYDKNVNCPEERYNGKDYSSYVRKMDKLKSLCGFSDSKGMLDYISRIGLNKLDVAKVDWHFYFEHTNLGRLGNNPFKMDDKECEELKTFFIKSYQV